YQCFFFQAEDGIRDFHVTGVQTCALPILWIFYRSRCGSVRVVGITVKIQTRSIAKIPDIIGLILHIPDFYPGAGISVAGRALFPHQYPVKAGKTDLIGCFTCPALFFFIGPKVFIISSLLSTAWLSTTTG